MMDKVRATQRLRFTDSFLASSDRAGIAGDRISFAPNLNEISRFPGRVLPCAMLIRYDLRSPRLLRQ